MVMEVTQHHFSLQIGRAKEVNAYDPTYNIYNIQGKNVRFDVYFIPHRKSPPPFERAIHVTKETERFRKIGENDNAHEQTDKRDDDEKKNLRHSVYE